MKLLTVSLSMPMYEVSCVITMSPSSTPHIHYTAVLCIYVLISMSVVSPCCAICVRRWMEILQLHASFAHSQSPNLQPYIVL